MLLLAGIRANRLSVCRPVAVPAAAGLSVLYYCNDRKSGCQWVDRKFSVITISRMAERGRPPKAPGEKLDATWQIRLKAVEKQAYEAAAAAEGFESTSEWARKYLNRVTQRRKSR